MKAERHVRHPDCERQTPGHRYNGDGAAHEHASSAPAADASVDDAREQPGQRDALKLVLLQFAELRESASYFLATQIDGARASIRGAIIGLGLSALGFVTLAGLVVTASGLALYGLAQGLGTLFGDRPWIGSLLTGLATLIGVGIGLRGVVVARTANARNATVDKHEERQAQQRTRFGRDVQGRRRTGADKNE
jgi:hypothetical protein